jgi:hypothetical protein
VADDHEDHAFVGFRSDPSDTAPRNRSPYSSSLPAANSFAMRFVKGETMNDVRLMKEEDDQEEGMATPEVKVEVKIEVKMEPEEDDKPAYLDATGRVRPMRWQSEPAIPKFAPIASPSRASPQQPPATPQPSHPFGSGRGRGGSPAGRGRGRGRGGQLSASPSSPADFHYSYTTPEVAIVIKQEETMLEDDNVTTTSSTSTIAIVPTQVEAPVAKPAQATDRKASSAKKNKKNEKKWKNRQLKNKHAYEPMDSDTALFTTRDVVRAKMQAGGFDKASLVGESSEEAEENEQADEDFLFGRGGRETRKGAPVRGKKKAPQQKGKKKGFVYDEDDEESDDDGMVLDEELIRDYMLNTNLASLNLDEEELDEQLLLHIVSQINDYHLTDDDEEEDDDDDDDEEEDDSDVDDDDDDDEEEDDSDDEEGDEEEEEDDSEEDFYDEYGDDEKEEEREQAKLLKLKAAQAKAKTSTKTPHGLASWDDTETAVVVRAAADEEAAFDAVLNADFISLRSAAYEDRPPGFQQRLRKQGGGGGGGGGGSWPGRDDRHTKGAYQGRGKKWKTPERGGRGRQTKKGKWYDREFNEETITDEEELPYIDRTPLKRQPRSPSGMVTVHSINEAIRDFINNPNKEWLELPPMNKKQRVMVHQLAELYHLESKSYGMGRHRFPTLVKTIYSCLPPQTELLTFLNRAAKIKATNGAPQPKRPSKEENKKLRKLKNMRKRDGGKETSVSTKRAMDGAVVGEGATPVGQETIGGRLLLSMGWTGGLVGTNGEGIAEPLMAIVKNNRKGLGF